ncbi:MAG: 3-isopropylmalate dehydratase, partial [Rhodospirillales bacterium]|nr:3-isopropylmalate dehydratase [Rhodospirillales bacterium]
VGGKNFGMGSSREQAAQVLKILGVTAVLAPSFGGIFYRNAFNLGLPAIILPNTDRIDDGQNLDIDLHAGKISNLSTGEELIGEAVPENLLAIVEAGGLVPFLETKFKQNDN